MDLTDIRQKIDKIDEKLLPLFIERMNISKEVAEYKKANGLPVLNRGREREILQRVMEQSGNMELYAHRFYTTIFELSRAYQDTLISGDCKVRGEVAKGKSFSEMQFPQTGRIACQGVEGAYGQMAADRMFPRGNLTFFKTFEAVFDAVKMGLCDYGIIPIENSANGSVRATYELLKEKNVKIVRSARLCIRHQLLAKPGVKLSDITEIHSHEQGLGQCGKFIKSLGDNVKTVPCGNTAMAAEKVALSDKPIAAIASHEAGKLYGLVPIAENIQNSDNNYTRFICIAKDTQIFAGADHISLIIELAHKPGSLYDILAKFAALEVNLIKLESCPILGHDFEFMFFFDLQANANDPKILSMLESIERSSERMIFLGNYSEV